MTPSIFEGLKIMIKMKSILKVFAVFCVFPILGICGVSKSFASTPDYYISPVFSEHQSKNVTTFFDLRWSPGESDKIGITITNTTDEDKTFQIKVNKARTNGNGVIDYSDGSKEESDASQPLITSMVTFPKSVEVAAHQSQVIYSTISFPQKDFNGIKMGGIEVEEQHSSQEKQNVVSYVLPLIIRGNIDQRPQAKITFGKFDLKQSTFHDFALSLPISNMNATLLKDAQVNVTLKRSDGGVVWNKSSKFLITPETTFVYNQPIDKDLKAGAYKVELVIKHGKESWESTQELTVSKNTASKMKQTTKEGNNFSVSKKKTVLLVIATVICTLFIIGLVVLLYRKLKKRN